MACGCALVTTNNGGSSEFATHGTTALCVEPGDVDGLAAHLVTLLLDDDRRTGIAQRGAASAARFRWDESARILEGHLEAYLADPDRYRG
jgi:glycosyltransferase involved in cell wall biosynthesis